MAVLDFISSLLSENRRMFEINLQNCNELYEHDWVEIQTYGKFKCSKNYHKKRVF